jgi:hypothetical protein
VPIVKTSPTPPLQDRVEAVLQRAAQTDQVLRLALSRRSPMPVRCEICEWRGKRLTPRSAPCPACGSRVEFA